MIVPYHISPFNHVEMRTAHVRPLKLRAYLLRGGKRVSPKDRQPTRTNGVMYDVLLVDDFVYYLGPRWTTNLQQYY